MLEKLSDDSELRQLLGTEVIGEIAIVGANLTTPAAASHPFRREPGGGLTGREHLGVMSAVALESIE